jgi:hypothetical protein
MNSNKKTMYQLGYLGLLPFIAGTGMMATNMSFLGLTGSQIFISYSVIILSFLSGVLWGRGLSENSNGATKSVPNRAALVASNMFALLVWGLLLQSSQSTHLVIVLLALGFGALWLCERRICKDTSANSIEGYPIMRRNLTVSVVALHAIAWAI